MFKDKSHIEKIKEASFFLGMFKGAAKTTGNDITGNALSMIPGAKIESKTSLSGQDVSQSDKLSIVDTALKRPTKELASTAEALIKPQQQLLKPAEPVKLNKGTSLAGNLYDKQLAKAGSIMLGYKE